MARYLGNTRKKEVHDLHNEKANCQINDLLSKKYFSPDTLDQAHREGFDNCHYCIGRSTR